VVRDPGRSRRALLGAGALAALAAAGCGDRTPAGPEGGDAAVLGRLLAVEQALLEAWVGSSVALRDDVVVRLRAHVRALQAAGAAPGGHAPRGIAGGDEAALAEAERAAGRSHLSAVRALRGPDARALATGLYAAAAQRESVLLAALGRDPLPDAFAGSLT
jgi:hypothetical protein